MNGPRLLGPRDTVVLIGLDEEILIGRGSHSIPANDKRCSRQSLKVRFDAPSATVVVTQVRMPFYLCISVIASFYCLLTLFFYRKIGVNPGIVNHGTPQEAYMVPNQSVRPHCPHCTSFQVSHGFSLYCDDGSNRDA